MSANGQTLALLDQAPPRVEILTSHADADGWLVDAALQQAARQGVALSGLIIAGTGHGTVHEGLEAALRRATQAGVVVWLSTRVARGGVQAREGDAWPACGTLTPAQARIALMLHLLDA
jgi:L-asparaginase